MIWLQPLQLRPIGNCNQHMFCTEGQRLSFELPPKQFIHNAIESCDRSTGIVVSTGQMFQDIYCRRSSAGIATVHNRRMHVDACQLFISGMPHQRPQDLQNVLVLLLLLLVLLLLVVPVSQLQGRSCHSHLIRLTMQSGDLQVSAPYEADYPGPQIGSGAYGSIYQTERVGTVMAVKIPQVRLCPICAQY